MENYTLHGHFYEREEPEHITIIGGEVRLYKEAKRLSFSKNPWVDEAGVERIGKTVTLHLGLNAGNDELIHILEDAIAILKK